MNPDDEEEMVDDHPEKQAKVTKIGVDFLHSFENRKLGKAKSKDCAFHLQAFAEDELVRKEYKEMVSTKFYTILYVFANLLYSLPLSDLYHCEIVNVRWVSFSINYDLQ